LNKAGSQQEEQRSLEETGDPIIDALVEAVGDLRGLCALSGHTGFETTGLTCPQHLCTVDPTTTIEIPSGAIPFGAVFNQGSSCCSEIDIQVSEAIFANCLQAEEGLASGLPAGLGTGNLANDRNTYCNLVPTDLCCALPDHIGLFTICLSASPETFPDQPPEFVDDLKGLLLGTIASFQGARNDDMSDTCFNSYLGVFAKMMTRTLLQAIGLCACNTEEGAIYKEIMSFSKLVCENNDDNIYYGISSSTEQRFGTDFEWNGINFNEPGFLSGYCNDACFDKDFYRKASDIGFELSMTLNGIFPSLFPNDVAISRPKNFFFTERKCAYSITMEYDQRIGTCGGIPGDDLEYEDCTNLRTIEISAESADGEKRKKKIRRTFCVDTCGIDDDSEVPLSEEEYLFMVAEAYHPDEIAFNAYIQENAFTFFDAVPHPLGNLCKDDIIKAEFVTNSDKCYPVKIGKAFDTNEQCGTTKYTKASKSSKGGKASKGRKI